MSGNNDVCRSMMLMLMLGRKMDIRKRKRKTGLHSLRFVTERGRDVGQNIVNLTLHFYTDAFAWLW